MDFVDSVTGTGAGRKSEATIKGSQKTREGIDKMEHKGGGGVPSQQTDPASGVVTVDDVHRQRAAGDHRYSTPTPRS